jgi:hypothetical protein
MKSTSISDYTLGRITPEDMITVCCELRASYNRISSSSNPQRSISTIDNNLQAHTERYRALNATRKQPFKPRHRTSQPMGKRFEIRSGIMCHDSRPPSLSKVRRPRERGRRPSCFLSRRDTQKESNHFQLPSSKPISHKNPVTYHSDDH